MSQPTNPSLMHELYTGNDSEIVCLAFSSNNQMLATAGQDGVIRVWNTQNGQLMHVLTPCEADPVALEFACEDRFLVLKSDMWMPQLWALPSGRAIELKEGGHHGFFAPHALSIRSGLVASPSQRERGDESTYDVINVWDPWTSKVVHELKGADSNIRNLAFSADGLSLVTYDDRSKLTGWEVSTGRVAWQRDCLIHTRPFGFSLGGGYVYARQGASNHPNHGNGPKADQRAQIWTRQGELHMQILPGRKPGLLDFEHFIFSPDDQFLVVNTAGREVALFDLVNKVERHRFDTYPCCQFAAFSPNGRVMVIGDGRDDHSLLLWDLKSNSPSCEVSSRGDLFTAVLFSPDGSMLAAANDNQVLYIWHM